MRTGRQARRVVQLAGGELEAQIEHLAAVLGQPGLELLDVELAQFGSVGHGSYTSTSGAPWVPGRTTKRALKGSFWMARSMAARARSRLDTGQLEEHPARADHRHPVLGVPLARAHTGLGRLLGDRLVGEDPDPHLSTSLDVAGHGDSGGLDLALGEPPRLERLDPEVAEVDGRGALGQTVEPTAMLLAVLDLAGHEHQSDSLRKCGVS